MRLLREYVNALLAEKELRVQKDKRTLHHAGPNPVDPKPKCVWYGGYK